jgi:hypothetical protein
MESPCTRWSCCPRAGAVRRHQAEGHPWEMDRQELGPARLASGNRVLDHPTQRLRQRLDLLPGGPRKADEAVTHPIPHASASCSREKARASSPGPGPGPASMRALATPRPTSRRSRFTSALSESSSARGMVTISDASALTRNPSIQRLHTQFRRGSPLLDGSARRFAVPLRAGGPATTCAAPTHNVGRGNRLHLRWATDRGAGTENQRQTVGSSPPSMMWFVPVR